jgi:hypothetical protein
MAKNHLFCSWLDHTDVQYILVEGAGHGDAIWYQPAIIEKVVQWFKVKLGNPDTVVEDTHKASNL